MQGRKDFTDKEVVHFRLSERVPPHNLYRRLAELVDWTFLYDETRALYSHTGQPWPWLKGWSKSRIWPMGTDEKWLKGHENNPFKIPVVAPFIIRQ